MQKYHLKVASGFKTAMDMYNNKLLLCTEVAHKLLNLNTVNEMMEKFMYDHGIEGYKQRCLDYFVGLTVMTGYNNKTYRIDDISWDECPTDSFAKKNGESITFIRYYWDQYNIRIKNEKQPLLISLQKERIRKPDQVDVKTDGDAEAAAATTSSKNSPPLVIKLVPELCVLTGQLHFLNIISFCFTFY